MILTRLQLSSERDQGDASGDEKSDGCKTSFPLRTRLSITPGTYLTNID
jgi:hypothetical protein